MPSQAERSRSAGRTSRASAGDGAKPSSRHGLGCRGPSGLKVSNIGRRSTPDRAPGGGDWHVTDGSARTGSAAGRNGAHRAPLWVGALAVTAPLAVCGGSSKRSARITIGDEVPWRPRQIHRHLTRATASILIRPAPSTLLPRLPRRRRTDDQHAPSRYVRFHDGHPSPSQNRTWKLPDADQPRQPSSLSCRQPRPAEARQPATKSSCCCRRRQPLPSGTRTSVRIRR